MRRSLLILRLIINLLALCTYLNPEGLSGRHSLPVLQMWGGNLGGEARVIKVLGSRTRIVP